MNPHMDLLPGPGSDQRAAPTEGNEADRATTGLPCGEAPKPAGSLSGDGQAVAEPAAMFDRAESERESQADVLVKVVMRAGAEPWHTPGGDLYITVVEEGRADHWPVESRDLKRWLRARYYLEHEKAPRSEAIKDALGVLEGRAMGGPEHEIHTRIAGHDGRIYIDLADRERHIVEIARGGWRVIHDAPVRFRRPAGTLPLPVPQRGGSIDELRPLINVSSKDEWNLLVGFIVGALHPKGPYLVLVLLLDPKDAPLRRPPREERDLGIAARHGRVLAFNNVSHLSDNLSDALSSLATEGGFVTRALFTDDEEARFRDRRPIILNGIPDFVTRGDLADRSVKLTLARISSDRRLEEAQILQEFEERLPRILGALYDAVAHALATAASVVLAHPPRMADAARWITAAEPALRWEPGTFVAAFDRALGDASTAVVESNPVALAIVALARTREWRGTAGELVKVLTAENDQAAKDKQWPRTPQAMASELRRCAPELLAVGVEVVQDEREDAVRRTRLWTIRAKEASPPETDGRCAACGSEASDAHECVRERT
jgi:hypothetical protein